MVDTGFVTRDVDRTTTLYERDEDGALHVLDPPDGDWARPPAFPSGAGGQCRPDGDWLAFCRLLLADGDTPDGRPGASTTCGPTTTCRGTRT